MQMSLQAPPPAAVKKKIVKIIRKVVPKAKTPLTETKSAEDAARLSAGPKPTSTDTAPLVATALTASEPATKPAAKITTTRVRKVVRKKFVVKRIPRVSAAAAAAAAAAGEDKEKAVSKRTKVKKGEGIGSSSPLRRSERIEESGASHSSGSEKSEKSSSLLDEKNKKKGIQGGKLIKEQSKDDNLEVQGGERLKMKMRLDARSYRASFKSVAKKTKNSDASGICQKERDDEGDRTEVYSSPREDLGTSGLAEYSSGGRSLVGVDVENGGEVRACKRAKMTAGLDSNSSAALVDNAIFILKSSTPDATSSSPNISIEECSTCHNPHSGRPEVMHSIDLAEEHINSTHMKESLVLIQADSGHNVCVICKHRGFLLCCNGKNCKQSYHLSCLHPPLKDVPPGVWHCLSCVRKKIKSGVYSVSEGIESIWDSKEGMQNEKLYLVKYKGLAHVHNRWVPESLMLLEAPTLLTEFNRKQQKEKATRWKEWTEPHRLLLKRFLMSPRYTEEHFSRNGNDFPNCCHEWLVKWKGLDYEHATWELESSSFLCSSEGMMLINNYEKQRKEARKASDPSRADKALSVKSNPFCELSSLPVGLPPELHIGYLNSINRLREFWHRTQSAVFIDDQERMAKSILFILTLLSHACRPFLIITSINSLSSWESEFIRLAPSINFVVYNGNKNIRKIIRRLEFYEEGGCIMFQVLLSHPDAIVEDVEALDCIGWEAIIVDECQNLRVSAHLEQFRSLSSDFRLILLAGQLKDDFVEYLNLLSFLDPRGQEAPVHSLNFDSDDSTDVLALLKKRLACYIAYERKMNSSKFHEYWVPVPLSTVQLEQYCSILLSNSLSLCSQSKRDHVGTLHDILISIRKCCDHPYLVDGSLRTSLTKNLPRVKHLDFEVNASGKLQLLDQILQEMKNRGLRVLILFQSIDVGRIISIGDILDDFLCERYGADSYERVDKGMITSKKQASLNMFNDKASGRFVFLIETRACLPSIKLSSLDAVIIFSSDWNPLNDLKALQKITIDSQVENVHVFRFYSSCTVEEKVLIFAKKNMILDSNIKNISLSICHSLLGWGASYLFSKLDEFHEHHKYSETSTDKLLLNALFELLTQIPKADATDARNQSVLVKAQQSGASYLGNIILVGEKETSALLDNEPSTFWSKLLEKNSPQWRYVSGSSQSTRRKVEIVYEFAKEIDVESDGFRKKRIKVGSNTSADPISPQSWIQDRSEEGAEGQDASVSEDTAPSCSSYRESLIFKTPTPIDPIIITKEPGTPRSQANVGLQFLPNSAAVTNDASHDLHMTSLSNSTSEACKLHMAESEEGENMCNVQKELHSLVKPDLLKLCGLLRFPKDVKDMAERLLAYIMKKHRVSLEPETIVQAFIVSVCWRAASCLKHTVDHKESLAVAKKYLNFNCNWQEVQSVHAKLQTMKNKLFHQVGASVNSFMPNSPENQSSVSRKDVSKVAMREASSEASSEHQKLEEGRYQLSMLTEDVSKDPIHERSSETASSDWQDLEEGEIRESPVFDGCSESKQPILVKQDLAPVLETSALKLQHCIGSLRDETLNEQIDLVDKICSKRLKELLLKQKLEVDGFKVHEDKHRMSLKKTRNLDFNLIRMRHIDPAVRNTEIKLLGQEFARKIFEFDQYMKKQRIKLAVLHINARNREKQIKDLWLEDAKSGRLQESFDKLPLSESGFMMEKFNFSGESRVPDGSANTPIMSGPSSDERIIETVGTIAEVPATVPRRRTDDMSMETATPAYESSSMNAVQSAELCRSAEMTDAVSLGCAGSRPLQTEISDSQTKVMNSVGNELDGMNIGSWTAAPADNEQHGPANSNGACLMSPLQSQTKFTSGALASGSSGCENSASFDQVVAISDQELPDVSDGLESNQGFSSPQPIVVSTLHSVDGEPSLVDPTGHDRAISNPALLQVVAISDQELPDVSDGLESNQGFSSPQPIVVSTLHSVDGEPSLVDPTGHDRAISNPALLQVSPSLCLASVVHGHASTPEPVRTEQEHLNQVYCSTHQTDALIQQPVETVAVQMEQSISQSVAQTMPSLVNIPSERAGLECLRSTDVIRETGYHLPHTFTMMQDMPTQGLHPNPLRNELMRLHKQENLFTQMHEHKKLLLNSECEKEVEKVRRNFETLIQNAEVEFLQEKKNLEMISRKINMNLSLAEEFRTNFIQNKGGAPVTFQGAFSSSVAQLFQASQPQVAHFPVAASPSTPAPAATTPTPTPTPTPTLTPTPTPTPTLPQVWIRTPASATTPVPLVGNPVGPRSNTVIAPRRSLHAGSGPRAPAPHLRPFRPAPNLVLQTSGTTEQHQTTANLPNLSHLVAVDPAVLRISGPARHS